MSVNVNQSEKFLSLDKPVVKVGQQSSLLGIDSANLDKQERQTFRATFEEQRAVEHRERGLQLQRNIEKNLENKREFAENQQDRISARNAQRSQADEKRVEESNRQREVSDSNQKEYLKEKIARRERCDDHDGDQSVNQNQQVKSSSSRHADHSNDASETRDASNKVGSDTEQVGQTESEKVEQSDASTTARSERVDAAKTAEAAANDEESGKGLPLESPIESHPECTDDIPLSLNSLDSQLQNEATGVKAAADDSAVSSEQNAVILDDEIVDTIKVDSQALSAKSQNPTEDAMPASAKTGTGNIALDSISPSAPNPNVELSEGAKVSTASQANLQDQSEQVAKTSISSEALSTDEQLNLAQNQKLSDGNIHSHSSAISDKNFAAENKSQIWNGKTDSGHFVNTQNTQGAANTTTQLDPSLANLRQSYNIDTGRVLDAQIKEVDKAKFSVVTEKAEVTEASTTNKSPIANSRWTQSFEQAQVFAKGNGLQTSIPTKFTSEQWANAVADKVLWLSGQRIQSAEIKLDPPELGPMQVRVSVHQDQASVQFVSHHQSVREALDQNVFRLREMFGNEGINLVDVNVSDHQSRQSMKGEGDSEYRGEGQNSSSTDNELTQEAEVLELVNLVDHYV